MIAAKRTLIAGLLTILLSILLVTDRTTAATCPVQPHATAPDQTTITTPAPHAVVTSPLSIGGVYDHSFEGVVPINILDMAGHTLVNAQTMNEGFAVAPYHTTATFHMTTATPACIVVYREHPRGDPSTPLAMIPVTLSPISGLPNTGRMDNTALLLGGALVLVVVGLGLRHHRATTQGL